MIALDIFVDGEGMLNDVPMSKIVNASNVSSIKLGVLNAGLESGKPSVGIAIPLPDGKVVLAQTSLKLFQQAAAIFTAKYGSQLDEGFPVVDGSDRKT